MARVIVLDPGHGGRDPGAIGPSGVQEKDVTLAVCKRLAGYLKPIADVHLTRWTDKHFAEGDTADLAARVEIANQLKAELFISIHCNSSSNTAARGTETYALAPGSEGEKLARLVQTELVAATGLVNRGVKFANFYVLRKTAMPAILIELAFISNPQEEQWLINADFQDACAKAIAKAIKKYYNLEEEKPMAEPWKELIMQWAQDELGISPEHKPDEPSPKWFTIAIQQRGLKRLEDRMKELEDKIKKLEEAVNNA